jgi:hypothetical protein
MAPVPSFAANILGDWGPWGDTQSFVTAAKMPSLIKPAPLLRVSLPGSEGAPDLTQVLVAPGLQYPWDAEFRWKKLPGATQYRLTVSEDADRSCKPAGAQNGNLITGPTSSHTVVDLVGVTSPPAPEVSHTISLRSDRTYYWWLMAVGPGGIPGGCAYGGQPVRFQTATPKASLLSPADGSKTSAFETTLTWKDVDGASGYEVETAKGSPSFTGSQPVTSPSMVLHPGALGTFYWRVRPRGPLSGDAGAESATWSFITELAPTKPALIFPTQEFWAQYGTELSFAWHPVGGATGYALTVYRRQADLSPGEVVAQVDAGFVETTVGAVKEVLVNVQDVTTEPTGYCWKVQAKGPGGLTGPSSDAWCYRTGAAAPTIVSPPDGAIDIDYANTVVTWTCPYSPGGYRVAFGVESGSGGGCGQDILHQAAAGATSLATSLASDTSYCVTVTSLRSDGSDGFWDQAKFRTRPAPPPTAQCKPLDASAATVTWPLSYTSLSGGFLQILWTEEDSSIAQYEVSVWSHGGGTLQDIWNSQPLSSASLQYGSTDGRLYNVLASIPGSASTGLLFGIVVSARTDKSCNTWYPVAVVDGLYLDW